MARRESGSPDNETILLKAGPKISRRRFGRNAAAMAAMTFGPAGVLSAAQETGTTSTAAAKKDASLTPEQTSDVEAKLANIVRKYGSRLTSEQREHLRHILTYNEKMLASIRAFPLENGDPPASVLKISRLRVTSETTPSRSPKGRKSGNKTREGKR